MFFEDPVFYITHTGEVSREHELVSTVAGLATIRDIDNHVKTVDVLELYFRKDLIEFLLNRIESDAAIVQELL